MTGIVAKFGGTSLAGPREIIQAANIVLSNPDIRAVVVSAPGRRTRGDWKVTDMLYGLCGIGEFAGLSRDDKLSAIEKRFVAIRDQLQLGTDVETPLETVRKLSAFTHRPVDLIVSRGEYIMARLFADLMGFAFRDAKSFVKFDEHGELDMAETLRHDNLLNDGRAYVVPGFYGALPDGSVRTFSRGGSDISGAVVAAVLRAESYYNYTDVCGVSTVSPAILLDSRRNDVLSREEMRELSSAGADVLHQDTFGPLEGLPTLIEVRNTFEPGAPGTLILPDDEAPAREPGSIVGIAGREHCAVITVKKRLMRKRAAYAAVCEVFARHKLDFDHTADSTDTLCVVLPGKAIEGREDALLADLHVATRAAEVSALTGISVISTVGNGMRHATGVLAKLTRAVTDAGASHVFVTQGASEQSIIIGVEDRFFADAVRSIYRAFVT